MPHKITPACPECGRRVDEFDPAAVRAVKLHPPGEASDGSEQGNGHDRLFHSECFPAAATRWKRVSRLH